MLKTSLSLVVLSALLAVGCTTPIDSAKLAGEITADAAKSNLTLTNVTCPPAQTAKAGGTFQCTVTDDQGTPGTVTVTMTDNAGTVSFKLDQKTIDMKGTGDNLEANLTQSAGSKVDVTCPNKQAIEKAGLMFTCDAKNGDTTRKVVLTDKNGDGMFDIAMQ